MRRRAVANDDSMELLLDTVCNVFGGIMFIAILLALLTGATTHQVVDEAEQASWRLSASEAVTLPMRLDDLRAGLEQVEHMREQIDLPEARQLEAFEHVVAEARERAEQRLGELLAWIDRLERETDQTEQHLEHRIEMARAKTAALEATLADLKQANAVDVRLPIERRTAKRQMIFLVAGGRVYWVPLGQASALFAAELNDHVTLTAMLGGQAHRVEPRPGGGFEPVDALDPTPAGQAILARSDPGHDFFDVWVRPDSVHAFRQFRRFMLRHGYQYNAAPLGHDEVFILSTTAEHRSVQ